MKMRPRLPPAYTQSWQRIVQGALPVFLLACGVNNWAAPKATTPPKTADGIVIEKSARTMKSMRSSEVLKAYRVALSAEPIGAKEREGDHRVPEGKYVIDAGTKRLSS
jgi:hypothetical protein